MERIFSGEPYRIENDELRPYRDEDKLVFRPKNVYAFFGTPSRVYPFRPGVDFYTVQDSKKVFGPKCYDRVTALTLSGVVIVASENPDNERCTEFLEAAWKKATPFLTSLHDLQLRFNMYMQQNEATIKILNNRLVKIEESRGVIAYDSQYWIDDNGIYHVRSTTVDVPGYWSPSQMAFELDLRSKSRRPHVQLVTMIMKTALGCTNNPKTLDPSLGRWFIVEFPNQSTGMAAESVQLRLTEKGMTHVVDWWSKHAAEYAIERKTEHGYYLDQFYRTYDEDPLILPFEDQVNPVGGNMNSADVIEVDVN